MQCDNATRVGCAFRVFDKVKIGAQRWHSCQEKKGRDRLGKKKGGAPVQAKWQQAAICLVGHGTAHGATCRAKAARRQARCRAQGAGGVALPPLLPRGRACLAVPIKRVISMSGGEG
ncbi:hypothetical protein MED193_20254 [Roseobacter sp. MED193]|nr:hypothetical protein MED193_20254 [Roseobacter sp. MED193]